jgi:hypothetical protein
MKAPVRSRSSPLPVVRKSLRICMRREFRGRFARASDRETHMRVALAAGNGRNSSLPQRPRPPRAVIADSIE